MQALFDLGVVERFRPSMEIGSAPLHFVLGELGAVVVAAELHVDIKELKLPKDRLLRISYSPRLGHLLASNTFFSRLARALHETGSGNLSQWWGEDRSRRRWGRIVLPDAVGQIDASGRRRSFFFEMDQGTESPSRLARKLSGYRDVSLVSEASKLLLFCFPDRRRESSARRALSACGLTIATATFSRHCEDPLGPNWLLLGGPGATGAASGIAGGPPMPEDRLSILELPGGPTRAWGDENGGDAP